MATVVPSLSGSQILLARPFSGGDWMEDLCSEPPKFGFMDRRVRAQGRVFRVARMEVHLGLPGVLQGANTWPVHMFSLSRPLSLTYLPCPLAASILSRSCLSHCPRLDLSESNLFANLIAHITHILSQLTIAPIFSIIHLCSNSKSVLTLHVYSPLSYVSYLSFSLLLLFNALLILPAYPPST